MAAEFIAVKGEEDTDHPQMLHTSRGQYRNYPGGKHHQTETEALAARERELRAAAMRREAVAW